MDDIVATTFRASKLLHAAASAQESMKQRINKAEISKKIDEIKYLSTQKNVPRLSLRKEIVHLEKKLEHIFDLEEKLLANDKKESEKVSSLKRQIMSLKNRINAGEDKDLREKVGKLYHILTELLAKSELKQNVALSESLLKELNNVNSNNSVDIRAVQVPKKVEEVKRASLLLHRIKSAKHELELKMEVSRTDPLQMKKLQGQIAGLEIKIQQIQSKYPGAMSATMPRQTDLVSVEREAPNLEVASEVKHTMMMGAPLSADQAVEIQTTAESGEHMSNLEGQLQTGKLTHNEEVAIQDEVIAELPLPAPPRIRK